MFVSGCLLGTAAFEILHDKFQKTPKVENKPKIIHLVIFDLLKKLIAD